MSRRLVGIAIVGLWLLMMGALVRRELGSGFLRGDVLLDREAWVEEPTESWLTLHGPAPTDQPNNVGTTGIRTRPKNPLEPTFGPRVGYAHMRQAPTRNEGIEGSTLDLEVRLELPLLGRQVALDLSGHVWRARYQRLAKIDFSIGSGEADFRLVGKIVGDAFTARIESGGETTDFATRLADDALFSTGFGSAIAFPVLRLGEQRVLQSFDPMTLRSSRSIVRAISTTTVSIGGEQVSALRLEVRSNGLRTYAWVDEAGGVLQATTPLGLSVRRSTKEEALRPIEALAETSELLRITAIQPTGPRPRRGAQVLDVHIPGVVGWHPSSSSLASEMTSEAVRADPDTITEEGLSIPLDWRQEALGDSRFRFTASTYSFIGSTTDRPTSHAPPTKEQLGQYLGSDAFIQSDHPKIRSQAEAIVQALDGDTGDFLAAMALHDWVYESLAKKPVLSLPSALEVLASQQGDCNEHTILYTALARSIGLPTRVAIGLVWSETYDGFYYHAWPEVWLADQHQPATWIALDPTLGQPMADATHIKLLEGSIDRWMQLLPFLGQLEIEILPNHTSSP